MRVLVVQGRDAPRRPAALLTQAEGLFLPQARCSLGTVPPPPLILPPLRRRRGRAPATRPRRTEQRTQDGVGPRPGTDGRARLGESRTLPPRGPCSKHQPQKSRKPSSFDITNRHSRTRPHVPQTAAASHPELALSAGGGGASSPAGKEPHDTRGVTQAGRTRARRLIPHSPTIPMARGAGPRQGVVTRVLRGAPGAPNNRALCLTPQSRLHRRSSDQQATAPPRLRQSQKTERKKRLHHASRSCFPLARDIPQRLECHWAGA